MLLKTEDTLRRAAAQALVEKQQDDLKKWVAEQTAHACYINSDQDPTCIVRQMGSPMHSDDVEKILRPLVGPNILFQFNWFNKDMKACYRLMPNGEKEYLFAYNYGLLPEYSIRAIHYDEYPDLDGIRVKSTPHIDRKDLPKHEWDGNKKEWLFDKTDDMPGMQKTQVPWHEAFRGWRTILIMCVVHKLVTPNEVERAFSAGNRLDWAVRMGKRSPQTDKIQLN